MTPGDAAYGGVAHGCGQIGVQGGEPEGQTAGKPVDREKGQQRAGQDQQESLEKQMPHAVERPRAVLVIQNHDRARV